MSMRGGGMGRLVGRPAARPPSSSSSPGHSSGVCGRPHSRSLSRSACRQDNGGSWRLPEKRRWTRRSSAPSVWLLARRRCWVPDAALLSWWREEHYIYMEGILLTLLSIHSHIHAHRPRGATASSSGAVRERRLAQRHLDTQRFLNSICLDISCDYRIFRTQRRTGL